MKHFTYVAMACCFLATLASHAQNLSNRSHPFRIDISNPKELKDTSVPMITWMTPASEISFQQEESVAIRCQVESKPVIREVIINIREKDGPSSRGSNPIKPSEDQQHRFTIERTLRLQQGTHIIELSVENIDGVISKSSRTVHIGQTALADAAKLNRKDYALLFVTDKYDNWTPLVNPISDGRTIALKLEQRYGYKVEIVENASQDLIFTKLRAYSERTYEPLDQVLIFFAGHGYFDETFKEGYAVVKESLRDDPGKTSYVSYNRLRSVINTIPCEHVFLMMDVCFGGTFDEALATSRNAESVYQDVSQSEYIIRKLAVKTRRYLTSGGKQYVSDGIPGQHSPFAKRVLEALESNGGEDGILTIAELYPYVEKLTPEPRLGKFGDDAPGSEFIFVVK